MIQRGVEHYASYVGNRDFLVGQFVNSCDYRLQSGSRDLGPGALRDEILDYTGPGDATGSA